MSTEKAVSQIRGPIGTTVDLTLVRDGKLLEIKIVRATIQVPETDDELDEKSGVYHIALFEFTSIPHRFLTRHSDVSCIGFKEAHC